MELCILTVGGQAVLPYLNRPGDSLEPLLLLAKRHYRAEAALRIRVDADPVLVQAIATATKTLAAGETPALLESATMRAYVFCAVASGWNAYATLVSYHRSLPALERIDWRTSLEEWQRSPTPDICGCAVSGILREALSASIGTTCTDVPNLEEILKKAIECGWNAAARHVPLQH